MIGGTQPPNPIGHGGKTHGYSLVECHIYRLCPLSSETPSHCISADVPLFSSHGVTKERIPMFSPVLHFSSGRGGGNINPGLHSVRSISGQTTTIIRLSITGHFQRGNSGTKTHQLRPYSCYLLSEHSCNSCQASQRSTQKCKIIKLDQLNIYISIFIYLCVAVIRAHTKCACPHVFICSLKRDLPRAHVHLTVEAESVGQGSRLVWLLALTQSWVNNAALISG